MLIAVISDSHDNLTTLDRAVDLALERGVERLLHAGDIIAPFAAKRLERLGKPVTAIFGNNDGERLGLHRFMSPFGEIRQQPWQGEIAGVRIAMFHEPEPVQAVALSGLFDLVVYGHTHKIDVRQEGGCQILNPGELGGWQTGNPTMALVRLPELEIEIVQI